MLSFKFDIMQTLGFAVLLLLFGRLLKQKIKFFETYCIPEPVIGGFIFAIVHLMLRQNNVIGFEFDEALKTFFMNMFFATIGFNASVHILKKGGVMVLKFLLVATVLAILQNVVAVLLAPVVKIPPILALMTASTPMTGGHGTSGGIASFVEEMGFQGAVAVAFTSATYGLVAGSLMGGPVGRFLIKKNNLKDLDTTDKAETETVIKPLDEGKIMAAFFHILIALFFGSYVTQGLNWLFMKMGASINFPSYLGAMIIGAIIRNVFDNSKFAAPMEEVSIVGNVSLNLFLAVALMTLRLWELADLAIPMIVLLIAQTVLIFFFTIFVTFNVMGRNYDAAVITAGHCGFGMGATPNAIANMQSVCNNYGYSSLAFFVVPIVGSLFIDFINVTQINIFIGLFK